MTRNALNLSFMHLVTFWNAAVSGVSLHVVWNLVFQPYIPQLRGKPSLEPCHLCCGHCGYRENNSHHCHSHPHQQWRECLYCCRYPSSADVALLEASLRVRGGDLAAADQVLIGLKSNTPVTALQAVLMRAQMAVTNDRHQQVSFIGFTV